MSYIGSNPIFYTIQILLICLVAEKVLENVDFYNCVFGFNMRCGSVMCRIKKNITIAHKNVAQHLVQCLVSDRVPLKSRERNHDYGQGLIYK